MIELSCILIISTFFLSIMQLFLFLHLAVSQIDQVIFHLKFVLNPIAVLVFALYFI